MSLENLNLLNQDDTRWFDLYGGDLRLAYSDKIHQYWGTINNKFSLLPSASTVLSSVGDKSAALMQWAVNCAIDHIRENGADEEALAAAKLAYKKVSKAALNTGSGVHNWVENFWVSITPPPMPESQEECNSVDCFLEWVSQHKVVPILTETKLASMKYKVAGTVDFFGLVDDEPAIIDYKTSKDLYAVYRLQTAAYVLMLLEEAAYCKVREKPFTRDGEVINNIPFKGKIKRLLLKFGKDSKLKVIEMSDKKELKTDITAFLHATSLYRWTSHWDNQTKPKQAHLEDIKFKALYNMHVKNAAFKSLKPDKLL